MSTWAVKNCSQISSGKYRADDETSATVPVCDGIDPNPETGGAESGVTYILFKNSSVSPIENHDKAVSAGDGLAEQFVQNN
ncbi:hypothetical protein [Streptomyces sp. NBRC 110028]|uniref:hypothetical protein n=1 Tax=Streptomyces sp. NBRC 110028 TaxID=1621260 RepID=UPI0006E24A9F